jgi:hypothetical protein
MRLIMRATGDVRSPCQEEASLPRSASYSLTSTPTAAFASHRRPESHESVPFGVRRAPPPRTAPSTPWPLPGHRFITENWRGKPLVTDQVIVNLIAATTTKPGLVVRSRLDDRIYAKGRRVSDKQLALVNLEPHAFHGEWNYTIHPTAAA